MDVQGLKKLTVLVDGRSGSGRRAPTVTPIRLLVGLIMLAGGSLIPSTSPVAAQTSSQGASVQIDAPASVTLDQPILLTLTVRQAKDIAGYEMRVLYDESVAQLDRYHVRDSDIRKFGRDVGQLGPVERPDGMAVGLYSCPVADCVHGGSRQLHGASGTIKLGTVGITPKKVGALTIKLADVKFVAADGSTVPVSVPVSTFVVQVGSGGPTLGLPNVASWSRPNPGSSPRANGPFDVTGDGQVSHADAMQEALDWQVARQTGNICGTPVNPALDVNHDGCIDVSDVELVAAHYSAVTTSAVATQNSSALAMTFTPMLSGTAFTVNSVADDPDAKPGDGICATAAGACTLRAAMQEANVHFGPDTISFTIPGSGVQTIQLSSTLPSLSDASGGTTVDGYTQPGSAPNTDPQIDNAKLMVQLRGNGADSNGFDALQITSSNNVIRGLAFYNMHRSVAFYGPNANNNTLVGDFIGTNATGTFVAPGYFLYAEGISLQAGASHNQIGSPALGDRNVISGNARHGIATYDVGTDYNVIQNNIIGLNPAGTQRLQNWKHGIDINTGSSYNLIGGTAQYDRNIISGNGYLQLDDFTSGTEVSHDSATTGNQLIDNCYGTDVTCNNAPSYAFNSHYGIRFEDSVNNNLAQGNVIVDSKQGGIKFDSYDAPNNVIKGNSIGVTANGTAAPNYNFGVCVCWAAHNETIGPGNVIANAQSGSSAPGIGVWVVTSSDIDNKITQNSVFNNASMGIDLYPSGPNQNNATGTASGANNELNRPTLWNAFPTFVNGADSTCLGCTIEVFKATSLTSDAGGGKYGQGQTYLGSATVDSSGKWNLYSLSGLSVGDYVTATATDAQGDTSEFTWNLQVINGTAPPPGATPPPMPTPSPTPPQCTTATPTSSSAYATAVKADHPSAYWRFGECSGSTAADSSGNGDSLAYHNSLLGQAGAISSDPDTAAGLTRSSTSYLDRSGFSNMPSTAFTYEGWVKSTVSESGIFSYAVSGNASRLLLSMSGDVFVSDGSTSLDTGVNVADGKWHYLAWTWRASDGQSQFYKDGVLVFTGTLTTSAIPNGGAVVVGNVQTAVDGGLASTAAFAGTIDEFALYNTALTASQIQTHFAAASGSASSPTATPASTPSPTAVPSGTPNPTATPSPTRTPTATPSPTPKPVVTPSPTATPTVTQTGTSTSSYASAVTSSHPVAYWRLGETGGSTAADSSGSGATLTYHGTTLGQPGAINGDSNTAAGLTGTTSSYLSSNPFNAMPSTGFTFEGWVKTTGTGTGIFSYAVPNNAFRLLLYKPENLMFTDGTTWLGTNVSVNDGKWHYLVWTWRSSDGQSQLYKDGTLQFTGHLGTTGIPNGGSLVLGQCQHSVGGGFNSTQAFNGAFDEFAVYNTVLSQSQISAHYTASGR